MSKKSQVHIFTSEPIGEKPVTDLSGIGPTIGKRLADKRFDKVCVSYNMDTPNNILIQVNNYEIVVN